MTTTLLRKYQIWAGWLGHMAKASLQQHHTELRAVLGPYVPRDAVVADIGAHAGQMTKLFAKMADRGRVYAFEPSAYALSVLAPAIRWNRISNVEIVPLGLSDQGGSLVLHTPIKSRGDMGFGLAHIGADHSGRELSSQDIGLTTFDEFAKDFQRLDLIKIDIEGWEIPALRGGIATIERFRPVIYAEIVDEFLARSGSCAADVWALLAPLGYVAFVRGKRVSGYSGPGDYLWLPPLHLPAADSLVQ